MSDTAPNFFANLPGFDFLKSLSSAQTASLNPWLKPTLDPEELDQRIQELKTVQFWLEQNAKALAASIQALEVQRMTLATLKQMNVDWTQAAQPAAPEAEEDSKASPAKDPMQMWTALASQFGQIAQKSMSDMQRHATQAASAAQAAKAQSAPAATAVRKPAAAKRSRTSTRTSTRTTRKRAS
jgi:hypothetical protein